MRTITFPFNSSLKFSLKRLSFLKNFFTLSIILSYILTYSVTVCAQVSFSGLNSPYCSTASSVTLTGSAAPSGTFTGPGITDNGNGTATFNPANAGSGGTISYSVSGISLSWTSITIGDGAMAGVKSNGTLWTSGNNNNGQLGLGNTTNYSTPQQVGTATNWATVSTYGEHIVALKTDGTIWAWGRNDAGQCGQGNTTSPQLSPVQIGTGNTWISIKAGASSTIAQKSDGSLWACGENSSGMLGVGNFLNQSSLTQIGSATDWTSYSPGYGCTMAIKSNGTLWAWGSNYYGQLGIGSTGGNYSTPTQVGSATDWAKAMPGNHAHAIKTNGTLWACGDAGGSNLNFGNGSGSTNTFIQVGSATDWAEAIPGYSTSVARKTNGTLWSWGNGGSDGRLGLGGTSSTATPLQIGTATNWAGIAQELGGSYSAAARRADGTLYTWGTNYAGQLANGNTSNQSTPQLIAAGTGNLSSSQSVVVNSCVPTITSFTPSSGTIGTLVTITGTFLSSPTALTIGGVAAVPISNNGTTLVAMLMPGATTGTVSVTTGGGNATSSSNFTVDAVVAPNTQQGSKITVSDNIGASQFARSVAISADGNTAVIGGWLDNSNTGATWIFVRSAGVWTQQAKLIGTGGASNVRQGLAVAISADGNTVISGEYQDISQEVYVFVRNGTTWSQEARIPTPSGGQGFGTGLTISADGNTAAVGGLYTNGTVGREWIFVRSAGVWTLQATLDPSNYTTTNGAPVFGGAAALSANGNTLAVGAQGDGTGTFLPGAIYTFQRTGTTWALEAKTVPTGIVNAATIGSSIAISADGNTVAAGGPQTNNPAGVIVVLSRSGSTWTQQAALLGTGFNNAAQGVCVGLSADGNVLVEGGRNAAGTAGACWVFTRSGTTWTQQSVVVGTGNVGNAQQGNAIGISADGKTFIQGGYSDNANQGAAWVFIPQAAPTISSFTPTSGCMNTASVVITGTGFTNVSAVTIGGTAVSNYTVNSTTQITATVGAGTTGTVAVTTPGGTGTSSGTFTINPKPTATVVGTTTVCQNSTSPAITFTGVIGTAPFTFTYKINTGGNLTATTTSGNSVHVSAPTTSTGAFTYTLLSVADANGCSQTQTGSALVTVESLPSASAGGSTAICSNATATVSGATAANGTIAWTHDGAGSITAGASTLSPTYTAAAGDGGNAVTLTITVTSDNSCGSATATATYTVNVNALPSPSITGLNTDYCKTAGVITLAASPSGGSFMVDAGSASTFDTDLLSVGSHTVSYAYTDNNSCSASTSQNFNVLAIPAAPVLTSNAAPSPCLNTSVTLTAPLADKYAWYQDGVFLQWTNSPNNTLTVTTSTTNKNYAVYTYSAATNFCPSDISNSISLVGAAPVSVITSSLTPPYCANNAPLLSAVPPTGSGYSYSWTCPTCSTTTNSPTLTPTAQFGDYSVTVTDANGCSKTSPKLNVVLNAVPVANAGADLSACLNTAMVLGGTIGSSGYAYSWTPATNLSATNIAKPNVTTTSVGPITYTFRVTRTTTGCYSEDQVVVTGSPLPDAATLNASASSVCAPATITLTPSVSNSVFWYKNGVLMSGLPSTGAKVISSSAQPSDAYSIVNYNGTCKSAAQSAPVNVTINVAPKPTISSTPPVVVGGSSVISICNGQTTGTAALVASVPSGSPTVSSYNWQQAIAGVNTNLNPVVTTSNYTATVAASPASQNNKSFRVQANYANGCSASSVNVLVKLLPVTCIVRMNGDSEENLAASFTAYPNPTTDNITLSLANYAVSEGQILLYNNLGKLVLTQSISLTEGSAEESLDLSSLATGMYNLVFQTKDGQDVQKIVKE